MQLSKYINIDIEICIIDQILLLYFFTKLYKCMSIKVKYNLNGMKLLTLISRMLNLFMTMNIKP